MIFTAKFITINITIINIYRQMGNSKYKIQVFRF